MDEIERLNAHKIFFSMDEQLKKIFEWRRSSIRRAEENFRMAEVERLLKILFLNS